MKASKSTTEPTTSITPSTTPSIPEAESAKRPFVPPLLIKQGKVADITQGGGFGSDMIDP